MNVTVDAKRLFADEKRVIIKMALELMRPLCHAITLWHLNCNDEDSYGLIRYACKIAGVGVDKLDEIKQINNELFILILKDNEVETDGSEDK